MGKVDIIATIILVSVLVLLGVIAFLFRSQLGMFFRIEGGQIGDACTLHTDCQGWGPGPRDSACCQGKCTKKQPDWAGIGYCPDVCKGWPSATNTYGTCDQTTRCPIGYIRADESGTAMCCPSKDGKTCDVPISGTNKCVLNQPSSKYRLCSTISGLYHWPRLEGEICVLHTDCAGYGSGKNDVACCSGVCKKKQIDWVGAGWCPEACKGWFGAPGGTCDPNACPPGFTPYGKNQCCNGKVVNGVCQGTGCEIAGSDPTKTCAVYTGIWHTPRLTGEECSDIRPCASGLGCCPGIGAFNPPGVWGAPRVCLSLVDGKCPQNVNTGCPS
jgi:hypothetical protein